MAKRIRTYLSGGMEYARKEGADWRSKLETWLATELGHSSFNPNVESKKFLKKRLPKGDFRRMKYGDLPRFQSIVRDIVKLDSKEIALRSDYVICYWDSSARKGAGTKGEISIARYFEKPVYLVTKEDPHEIPGWVLGCTTKLFKSFDELKSFLRHEFRNSARIA